MITYFYCSPFRCSSSLNSLPGLFPVFISFLFVMWSWFTTRFLDYCFVPCCCFFIIELSLSIVGSILPHVPILLAAMSSWPFPFAPHTYTILTIRSFIHLFIHLIPWFATQLSDTHLMTHLHHPFIYSFIQTYHPINTILFMTFAILFITIATLLLSLLLFLFVVDHLLFLLIWWVLMLLTFCDGWLWCYCY